MNKYYYTYKITLLKGRLKGHYYYGQHQTTKLNDNYISSGKKIKDYFKKYKAIEGETYIKEIIAFYNNQEELNQAEYELIGTKYETDPMCLNMIAGGLVRSMNEETKQKIRDKAIGRPSAWKGCHFNEEQRKNLSERAKQKPKRCWVYKDDTEYLINESELNDYIANGYIKGRLLNIWGRNKSKKPDSEETRYKKGSFRGKRWINNGIIQIGVYESELSYYLENGWVLGYVKTNKNKVA